MTKLIEEVYPTSVVGGPANALSSMRCVYCMRRLDRLSDAAVEEAFCEIVSEKYPFNMLTPLGSPAFEGCLATKQPDGVSKVHQVIKFG